jgi:hypothetical protein
MAHNKTLLFISLILIYSNLLAQQKEKISWIGNQNRIQNPGAEANIDNLPSFWKTDNNEVATNDFSSEYGVTSHEWNSGTTMLGLPKNCGKNYFRIHVNNETSKNKVNLYQEIDLADLKKVLSEDTVMAVFSAEIASNSYQPENCSFAELRLVLFHYNSKSDTLKYKKIPAEFKDLDVNDPNSIERGFSVMHQFQRIQQSFALSPDIRKIKIELYAEYPCKPKNEEDDSEYVGSNTFFFDNLSLGFYRQ